MDFEDLLERFDLTGAATAIDALRSALPVESPADWRNLAAVLAHDLRRESASRCRVFAISGGQGAGKSTLARLLVMALEQVGLRADYLALDDFYLTRSQRQRLARDVHPLLATRGVPGTHDVDLAASVIAAVTAGEAATVPRFEKGTDDRCGDRLLPGGLRVLVFEGWCLGAPPQPVSELREPVNDLERAHDRDGRWRGYVNRALAGPYAELFARFDTLLYLQVPDFEAVLRWRTEQEEELPPQRRMSAEEIARFVAHYDRLTLWMQRVMADRADLVGVLDDAHRLCDLCRRDRSSRSS